ncbi:MAG: DUF4405 domain-containing protein [Erysipelotrichaceae bacterium]|nr:DUF4405 domain-containing protein [Erysipelotrichaceae bacterium]
MTRKNNGLKIRRIIDVLMSVLLIFLMAYQVTGEVLHEWIGIGMTLLVIFHQILNRRWYGALFKGRYNAYRGVQTLVNILLILSFLLTAVCGMAMSAHAVPFLYGILQISFARRMHLSMSYWSFVLMGMHLGLHIPVIFAGRKFSPKAKTGLTVLFVLSGGISFYLFLQSGMTDYLLFRAVFAMLDYEKPGILVLLENLMILVFWVLLGTGAALVLRKEKKR